MNHNHSIKNNRQCLVIVLDQLCYLKAIIFIGISCPEIEGPENGRTLYTSDMRYQGTAIQFCNDGYTIRCPEETLNTEPSSAKSNQAPLPSNLY